jgi:hypothetical protein
MPNVYFELTRELNRDRRRLESYLRASRSYLLAFHERRPGDLPLGAAHPAIVALAEELLPLEPGASWPRGTTMTER